MTQSETLPGDGSPEAAGKETGKSNTEGRKGRMQGQEEITAAIRRMCKKAGENETFAADFEQRLLEEEEIAGEFLYYLTHQDFACRVNVCGYTVVDILVWQIDHFKAWLDRDTSGTGQNKDRMLLLAFDTLLKMKKEPEKYLRKLKEETGTDYPDKYK